MSEKMIERVAKAIPYMRQIGYDLRGYFIYDDNVPDKLIVGPCKTYKEADHARQVILAKAAIQAMREPTEEMDAAMRDECISQIDYTKAIYKAAIDAALNF